MKLNEITKLSQLMEVLNWDLDESGLYITDYDLLAETIANRFPELEDDMAQFNDWMPVTGSEDF